MAGHIRKRTDSKGTVTYQVILDKGIAADGKRLRSYSTFNTLKEARAMLAEQEDSINKGTYIEPSKMTVQELCEEWFRVHAPKIAANTQRGYRVNLDKHIYPLIGGTKVQQLTASMLTECYEKMLKSGLNARSVQFCHTTLHAALKYGMKARYLNHNVAELTSPPKQEKYKPYIYTDEEIKRLLAAVEGSVHEIPVKLAIGLGLRRGEVLGLMWSDVDFRKNTIEVRHNLLCVNGEKSIGDPKTEAGKRTLVVPEELMKLLRKHKTQQAEKRLALGDRWEDNDLVCCTGNGTPYHAGSYSVMFHRFLERKGLPHCRFHDLRHINATLMLKSGVNMKVCQTRLGHSDISTTMDIYSHVDTEMQSQAANNLNNILFGQAVNV